MQNNSKWKIVSLFPAHVRTDGGTQSRVELDEVVIEDYADAMACDETFPPTTVFNDGSNNWLADGFHRHAAAIRAKKRLMCEVRPGSKRDAVLFSVGANTKHGLRRTNADKHKAVETILSDLEWRDWSDREVAKRCGVSHEFVRLERQKLSTVDSFEEDLSVKSSDDGGRFYTTPTGKIAVMSTANIGAKTPTNPHPLQGTGMAPDAEIEAANAPTGTPADDDFDDSDPFGDEESETGEREEMDTFVETFGISIAEAKSGQSEDPKVSNSTPLNPSNSTGLESPSVAEEPDQKEAAPLSIEEQIEALPLCVALRLYGHKGHYFRAQAALWHTLSKDIKAVRAKAGHWKYNEGPMTEAAEAFAKVPEPAKWEGCAACKGSLRFGERRDPCDLCKGKGFTTHQGTGVSADVVTEHAKSL